ncbi:NAD(P)H-binding protein [Flavobacterium sp. GA093]|uniref:NAD(P)H-binding protein n=1 Tax=Flavobacterium hydrocarbonoxydans TaxID=2683249 RepID=A0A6I4NQX1_9FLAO|nr:NAD(P)H-binding protein [Flavobacterium hydrocarbonoxydans]MWB95372.1 NAD(P)H-binding protein [Flavobacterium hydrocarbonoxydans]
MKIIITGSLGNISKPLAIDLVQKGHIVTVISSNAEKQSAIEAIGAIAAIGSLEDTAFLTQTFTGSDVVYIMVPPNNYFDQNLDLFEYYVRLGNNYAKAIEKSGVKRVVNLSTIGAHLAEGSGILTGAHHLAKILDKLPEEIAITHMRPTSFYYNLLGYAEMIKAQGLIAANYGADRTIPWVSPIDIADAIANEITTPFTGRKICYVVSEELTGDETARIIGEAIGMPELKWKFISNEETLAGLTAIGMNPKIAAGLVEMYASLYSGLLGEDFQKNKPSVIGKVKLKDYAKEFAAIFNQK